MPLLMLCIGCILFALSVLVLYSSAVSVNDLKIIQILNGHQHKAFDQLAIIFAYVGGMPFMLFLTTLWGLFYTWCKKYLKLALIVSGMIGSIALGWILKWCFERPRPPEIYHLVSSYRASFPSVHSTYAATFACLMILIFQAHPKRLYIMGASLLWMLFMGVSRIYAGVHYPTDVLAGWSIGFIWISLLWLCCVQGRLDKNKLFLDKI